MGLLRSRAKLSAFAVHSRLAPRQLFCNAKMWRWVRQERAALPRGEIKTVLNSLLCSSALPFGKAMQSSAIKTRRRILRAALKQFADRGYAGAPVQKIVSDAKVTKPTLYYYFKSKAGLYQAVLDWAYDERYRVMQDALRKSGDLRVRLVELLHGVFGLLRENSDLTRIALTTAFASRGEIPSEVQYLSKGQRNFGLVCELIRSGVASGEITNGFAVEDIAMNFYGMMNIHVMNFLFCPKSRIDHARAEEIVQMFLEGLGGKKRRGS